MIVGFHSVLLISLVVWSVIRNISIVFISHFFCSDMLLMMSVSRVTDHSLYVSTRSTQFTVLSAICCSSAALGIRFLQSRSITDRDGSLGFVLQHHFQSLFVPC